ncbi:hypothetical protein Tco_0216022 [Tanacetum coccineum]
MGGGELEWDGGVSGIGLVVVDFGGVGGWEDRFWCGGVGILVDYEIELGGWEFDMMEIDGVGMRESECYRLEFNCLGGGIWMVEIHKQATLNQFERTPGHWVAQTSTLEDLVNGEVEGMGWLIGWVVRIDGGGIGGVNLGWLGWGGFGWDNGERWLGVGGMVVEIYLMGSYALSWKPCQGDSLNLPDHRAQVDQGSQIKMIQVKEMMQDNDLKNSKSKDKGSKSRSQSMDEQSHYKQDKTITRQSINVKRHIFNVIGGTEEFEERDLNIGGDC